MKAINVYFEDKELEHLKQLKGNKSWHDFIMQLIEQKEVKENEKLDEKNI